MDIKTTYPAIEDTKSLGQALKDLRQAQEAFAVFTQEQVDRIFLAAATGRCHCAVCNRKFQIYLEKKYGTIAEFNKKSGSIFWSQEYGNFNQINIPVNTIEMGGVNCISNFYENPTICLEFERFASDSLIEYQDIQLNELRSFTKSPITTNATGLATNSIDYYKSTKRLDNYAFDFYPGLRNAEIDSYHYAFARGVKEGKHFWVLEFMSGGGHRLKGSGRQQPNPGALKQAVLHAYANGADLMLHFQFRSFPFGSEQLNYAIVDTDGVPRRRYYEMKETSELLKKLEKYQSAYFDNQVAICIDYAVYWALRIKPVNNSKFQYHSFCSKLYNSLAAIGINADVISYNADFSKYKMVILPSAFILSKKNRQKFKAYVKNGGVLFSTFLTSVKNENNVGYVETLPAGMTDLFGITVEEVEPIFDSNQATVRLKMEDKHIDTLDCGWCDLLAPVLSSENHTNCMIGNYIDSYKAGQGVISKNEYGKGTAYYMGTDINEDAMGELFDFICTEHNIFKNPFKNIKGVQIFRRVWEGQFLYYIFNFTNSVQVLKLSHVYYDCVSDMLVEDEVEIPQIGFIVLRECIVE